MVSGALLCDDRYGNLNSAYLFDGINDIITFDRSPLNDSHFRTECTISVWIAPIGSNGIALAFNDKNDTDYFFLSYQLDKVNSLYTLYAASRKTGWSEYNNIKYNSVMSDWYHLVTTFKRGTAVFYVNGVEVGKSSGYELTGIDTFNIGADQGASGGSASSNVNEGYASGKIDDIRIYNRALTPFEISNLYKEKI